MNTLKKAMKKSGHKAHEVAVKVGVSVSTIYNTLNGVIPKSPFIRDAIEQYIRNTMQGGRE